MYNNLGEYVRAGELLEQVEGMMHIPMPEYGQVVSGKIALQKAFIALAVRHDYATALRDMSIALARAYVFADQHRYTAVFERLVEQRLKEFPTEALQEFRTGLERSTIIVHVHDLPYQHPEPERWARAWARSAQFLSGSIGVRLGI